MTRNGASTPKIHWWVLLTFNVALVKVDDLKPVRFREKAFKRLVIRQDYKRIIKAMVEAYRLEKPGFSDIVGGKGRGLTVLLHGPPGTGKTLTAGESRDHLRLLINDEDLADRRQNVWQKNTSVLFSQSVAEI